MPEPSQPDGSDAVLDRPACILCVDDDLGLLESLEQVLAREFPSYRVVASPTAEDAMETLLRWRDDASPVAMVLSDEVMPGTSGTDLLEAVGGLFPDAARVILTGQPAVGAAVRGLRLHLDDFLQKPFTREELTRTLRRHLDNFELRRENARLRLRQKAAVARVASLMEQTLIPVDEQLRALATTDATQLAQLRRVRREVLGLLLLSQAAVDTGELASQRETLPLQTLAVRALEGMRRDGYGTHRVDVATNAQGITAEVDPRIARLVIHEVVANALEHSPENSTVEVRALAHADRGTGQGVAPPSYVELFLRRGGVALAVTNRADLSSEAEANIQRVLLGDARSPAGGFGLAFAAWGMELMRGILRFQGRPGGHGATLYLCFAPPRRS